MKGLKMQELLKRLLSERKAKLSDGIYHFTQIKLAYNSNRIEGSMLSEDQTRSIYETKTFLPEGEKAISTDDVIETINHFAAFDYILDHVHDQLSEDMVKELHRILKRGTTFEYEGFPTGDYKKYPNVIGGITETTMPADVPEKMEKLLVTYQNTEKSFDTMMEFHVDFERIHPFQDGNGRVGRLILFKECLHYDILPFIVTDEYKAFYYRGLQQYNEEKGYLKDTLLLMQDQYEAICDYFEIFPTKTEDEER